MNAVLPTDGYAPQLVRILKLAAIERERGDNNDGGRIGVEHLLVAFLQEDNNVAAFLIKSAGLSISDLRNGKFTAKQTSVQV